MASKKLSTKQRDELLHLLQTRFGKNIHRHPNTKWGDVQARLEKADDKLWSLNEMERTGGEPDVVEQGQAARKFIFIDCSAQSPNGRRSLCYDAEALAARKENKPRDSAMNMAKEMGVDLLAEDEYRQIQQLEEFDTKTSSWVSTPQRIRDRGGALFGDRRYDTVFLYHNGADAYYAARGFRAALRL